MCSLMAREREGTVSHIHRMRSTRPVFMLRESDHLLLYLDGSLHMLAYICMVVYLTCQNGATPFQKQRHLSECLARYLLSDLRRPYTVYASYLLT